MDGQRSRTPRPRPRGALAGLWLPTACLLLGPGCVHPSAMTASRDAAAQAVPEEENKDSPRHPPHASTCVALGDLHARVAAGSPTQQDQIRQQACRAYQEALKID